MTVAQNTVHDVGRVVGLICVSLSVAAWNGTAAGEFTSPLWDRDGLIGWQVVSGTATVADDIASPTSEKVVLVSLHVAPTIRWTGQVRARASWRLAVGWLPVARTEALPADELQLQWISLKPTEGNWQELVIELDGAQARIRIGDGRWRELRLGRLRGLARPCVAVAGSPGDLQFGRLQAREPGFQSLMRGNQDWESADGAMLQNWSLGEKQISCLGGKGPWLRSRSTYRDFALHLEYRLRDGGNSGVYVRVPKDGNHHGVGAGIEVQILDDRAPRYAKLKPYQFCGSLYAIVPAWPRVGHPSGTWNALDIIAQGSHYQVIHNGVLVVDAEGIAYPQLYERRRSGWLGLQNHREPVDYRGIRIRELSKSR